MEIKIPPKIEAFIFAPIDSRGASILRMAWSAYGLVLAVSWWIDAGVIYSTAGIIGNKCTTSFCGIEHVIFSASLFHTFFLSLCVAFICTFIGYRPKTCIAYIVICLWFIYFRNLMVVNAAITLEKLIGLYLLCIPNIYALSIAPKKLQNIVQPIWTYRLFLWQIIVIYTIVITSKLTEGSWLDGVSMAYGLHAQEYIRFSQSFYDSFQGLYVTMGVSVIFIQALWLALLVPASLRSKLRIKLLPLTYKQFVIVLNVSVHLGILIFMEVGSFSILMYVLYCGIIRKEDLPLLGFKYD